MIVMTWKSFLSARKAFLRLEETWPRTRCGTPPWSMPNPKGQLSLKNVIATAPSRPQAILKDLTIDSPQPVR